MAGKTKRGKKLAKRLGRYSLAAGAVLAQAQDAEAKVVYSGVINQTFGQSFGDHFLTVQGSFVDARLWGRSDLGFGSMHTAGSTGIPYTWATSFIGIDGIGAFMVNGRNGFYYPLVNALATTQYVGPATNVPSRTAAYSNSQCNYGSS